MNDKIFVNYRQKVIMAAKTCQDTLLKHHLRACVRIKPKALDNHQLYLFAPIHDELRVLFNTHSDNGETSWEQASEVATGSCR